MNRRTVRMISILTMLVLLLGLCSPAALADGNTETPADTVQAVREQLEAIDTLQEMQDKKYDYKVTDHISTDVKGYNHYDTGTTNTEIIEAHEKARAEYEAYLSAMIAARSAAQKAYDKLTGDQKAQIDSSLVAKLNNGPLSTTFKDTTLTLTPGEGAYTFDAVNGGAGYGYEVSNYMVSGNIPQTFILVDTSDGKTSWSPNGRYEYGKSNYEVTYCSDVEVSLDYSINYKRINLEDSSYYGPKAASHIRAILTHSYPYVSMDEMKSFLKSKGLDSSFVNSLNRADMISAVQMAVWTYANAADGAADGLSYFASVSIPKNTGYYFTPLHDYSNEIWDWLPGAYHRSYNPDSAYRVNNLAHFLCTLPGEGPDENDILITDIEVARAELAEHGDGYNVGVRIFLNTGSTSDKDNLTITVSSGQTQTSQSITSEKVYEMTIYAKKGDTIKVTVDGTQYVGKNVYFYEPEPAEGETERSTSQNLVGVGKGKTRVHAEQEFTFKGDIQKGLRIYKTSDDAEDGYPISGITFSIYKVTGEVEGSTPTEKELALYKTSENKVGSVTTDETGYASIALEDGTYLVVEEHSDKVEKPVDPFYITIPTTLEHVMVPDKDGTMTVEVQTFDILSIYPKNTPVTPDEPEPELPPTPDDVKGHFAIVKVDEIDNRIKLEGAEFKVYRPAVGEEEGITITCDGVDYFVVDTGKTLITDSNGYAKLEDLVVGTYFLVETKAPDGYNLPKEAFKVTAVSKLISAETTTITNQRGHIMPETGGMGTTPLLTAGAMLIAAAALLLAAKKRRFAK
ncbi:MAG: Cys-Gln thioester bond-forming surface protein [Clostridia bacterium]|nr:Cys-Gln thioester bond-forming surface protein [Clostridia bacterium]